MTKHNHLHTLITISILSFCAIISIVNAQNEPRRTHSSVLLGERSVSAQVLEGADLFYEHCAVCHGDRAQGLSEARLSFPEDHQKCESCHRPNNPPVMDLERITARNAFSVGIAPALHGEGALASLPNGLALFSYIRATMPRPFPGTLTDEEYLAISAFLLSINDAALPDAPMTQDNALEFSLP